LLASSGALRLPISQNVFDCGIRARNDLLLKDIAGAIVGGGRTRKEADRKRRHHGRGYAR
jgi:hypothetical protein